MTAPSSRALVGATPIPGDAPAGANVRYEPEFERLQAEVSKIDTEGPKAVDWKLASGLAGTILAEKSKDLLVAAYYVYGLLRTESYAGLADGLTALRDMMNAWWDDLNPPRKRENARAAAINWMAERLAPIIEEQPVTAGNAVAVAASYELVQEIEALGREKFENAMLLLGDVSRALRFKAGEAEPFLAPPPAAEPVPLSEPAIDAPVSPVPVPGPTSASAQAAAPAPVQVAAASAPSLGEGASPAQIDRAIDQTAAGLRTLANAVRQSDPSDPRAIELMRAAIWLPIKTPPAHKDGVTPLNPPSADRIQRSREWLDAGQHLELFDDIEKALDNFPYWFDGQRLAAMALDGLGTKFAPVRAALVGSLATLLRRLPALIELRYANGAPFAEEATLAWLQSDVLAGGGASGGADPWAKPLRDARDALAQGRAKEAVAAFGAARPAGRVGRMALGWDLALARLCLEAEFVHAALDIATELDRKAAERRLEDWEPDLSADISALILNCYRALPGTGEGGGERGERIAAARARLAWLDTGQALQFIDVV